jgi:Ca-activated chloride channel family protein
LLKQNLFTGITFASPWFLWFLALVPVVLYYSLKNFQRSASALSLPGTPAAAGRQVNIRILALRFLPFLRALSLSLIIIALARPQSVTGIETIDTEGIDIVMATDLSKSMELEDFKPNRIEAAKKIGIEFINRRPSDRIGLVVFAGESFTLCPLTIDHSVVISQLAKVTPDFLENGTAIGMGLATCVDRLRESNARSRVAILLTDGVNNSGSIDPMTAAELAVKYRVKVYTIGVGSINGAELQLPGMGGFIPSDIDEALLQNISKMTGGRYFRATDNAALRNIYQEIDRLEKVKIQSSIYQDKTEMYFPWLIAAFFFIGIEFLARFVFLKAIS